MSSGVGGGGGHGGKGGDGFVSGDCVQGGIAYGNTALPCELGSGSGNDSMPGSTAGGGVIGELTFFLQPSNFTYLCELY